MKKTTIPTTNPTMESLQVQVEELTAKVKWYEEQFRLSQQKKFGSSSEKTPENQIALELFNEVEQEANPQLPEPTVGPLRTNEKRNVAIVKPYYKTCLQKQSNIDCLLRTRFVRVVVEPYMK